MVLQQLEPPIIAAHDHAQEPETPSIPPRMQRCSREYRFRCSRCDAVICLHHVCTADVQTELRFAALWQTAHHAPVPLRLEPGMLCVRCFDALYPEAYLAGLGQRVEMPEQCEGGTR